MRGKPQTLKLTTVLAAFPAIAEMVHVNIGIVARPIRFLADHDKNTVAVALVDQAVAVGIAFGKTRAIASAQLVTSIIIDEYRFSVDHHQKFILLLVPVALRRPCAGFQNNMADAKIAQPARGRQPPIPAPLHFTGILRRIASRIGLQNFIKIELWHRVITLQLVLHRLGVMND